MDTKVSETARSRPHFISNSNAAFSKLVMIDTFLLGAGQGHDKICRLEFLQHIMQNIVVCKASVEDSIGICPPFVLNTEHSMWIFVMTWILNLY